MTRDLWPGSPQREGPVSIHELSDGPAFGLPEADILYMGCQSFATLFSAAHPDFSGRSENIPDIGIWGNRMVAHDWKKDAVDHMKAFAPDWVVIDLIAERFDLLRLDSSLMLKWVSLYWDSPISKSGTTITRSSQEARELWLDGLDRVRDLLRGLVPERRIVFHDARWATRLDDADRTPHRDEWPLVDFCQNSSLSKQNSVLSDYSSHLRSALPEMPVVSSPDQRLSAAVHHFGVTPFHFSPSYNRAISSQLRDIMV